MGVAGRPRRRDSSAINEVRLLIPSDLAAQDPSKMAVISNSGHLALAKDAQVLQLCSIDLSGLQKKIDIRRGLIVWVSPGEELAAVLPEVYRDLREDPLSQINSVVEILRGREAYFRVLDVARIEVYRAFYRWVWGDRCFQDVGLSLDLRQ